MLQALIGYGGAMPKNCYTHLSVDERETLSLGLAHSYSMRTMARVLGRAPSTVNRGQARLAQRLSTQVFFADPHSPWQHGPHENSNGLLRQYLPNGTDLSGYTQRKLNTIAHWINTRPRQCFN